MTTKRIALWSGPRNVSTALMYSFANREDCIVKDEPLFGYFLKKTGVWRPSRDEALKTMELDSSAVLKSLNEEKSQSVLFMKHMANHLEGLDYSLCNDFVNVILCRHPLAVLSSYTAHIDKPTALDLCYEHQLNLLKYLSENGLPFYILNSDELRGNPAVELSLLCSYLKIPYSKRMLKWPVGARPEDGVWAKYWYHNVHKSSGFTPPEEKKHHYLKEHSALLESSEILYQQIMNYKV